MKIYKKTIKYEGWFWRSDVTIAVIFFGFFVLSSILGFGTQLLAPVIAIFALILILKDKVAKTKEEYVPTDEYIIKDE